MSLTYSKRLYELNIPFFRFLFNIFQLDVGKLGCLDIGCDDGFLSASMEKAGARYVIATDLRMQGLLKKGKGYSTRNVAFAAADMFEWCYTPNSFACISIRNNSAFCKAENLDGLFDIFIRNVMSALSPGGIVYLSFLSNGSGQRSEDGFRNFTLQYVFEFFHRNNVHVIKLMKLGTMTAMLLCRPEDKSHFNECKHNSMNRLHTQALKEYFSSFNTDRTTLKNFFLATADDVSELAYQYYTRKAFGIVIIGQGIYGYYIWRMLSINFPEIPFLGFIIDKVIDDSVFQVLTRKQAEEVLGKEWEKNYIALDINSRSCKLSLLDKIKKVYNQSIFPYGYHYISGDHDEGLFEDFIKNYFTGRLKCIDENSDADKCLSFEKKFLKKFPFGYKGL